MDKSSFAYNLTLPLLLLLLLLLSPSHDESKNNNLLGGGRGVVTVDARTCESQSHGFKGRCLSDHNCGLVCKNEGFNNGRCRGFRQRCFCTKNC